ncbi:MAG: phage antirepressor [Brochothrix thermosphacta]|uniref:phage antirepressor n=1 Tax=Brochothrix thermosphacta TaxID=2756 RepID=UPI003F90D121
MNTPQIFNFEKNEVRTFLENEIPYFVANDVAKTLGYKNPSDATNKHCKNATKTWGSDSLGRRQTFKVIPESDVYRLIIKSNLPSAEKFEAWVMEEVLPTIRKHGAYLTDEKAYDITHNPNSLADILQQASEQLRQKDLVIEEMKPKALFADAVSTSQTTILVGELAKLLKQNGVDIGATRLFKWLRDNQFLINRRGSDWNMPTQKSMNMELFQIKETNIQHSDGHVSISKTAKVTGKGQQYFINKFLNMKSTESEVD